MSLLHIGDRYINLANVTSILDKEDTMTIIFIAAWPGDNIAIRACEHFYDDEARQLRRWLERNSERVDRI